MVSIIKERPSKAQTRNVLKHLSMRARSAPFDGEKYINRLDITLPPTQRDAILLQTMKRQPDITSKTHSPPMKRSRLIQTDTKAGPPRRSVRLRTRQLSTDQDATLKPCHKPQITAGARRAAKRASIHQIDVDRQQTSRAAENTQQSGPLEHPYSPPQVEREDQFYPATLLRKRQNNNSESEHQQKRTRLTREALALFNKMGEGEGKEASAPAPLEATVEWSSTAKTISTSMSEFAMQARKNGILGPLDSKPPENLDDIRERHTRSRGTPSPTESMYRNYTRGIETAPNEATVAVEVGMRLLKSYSGEPYNRAFNKAFTGFPKNAGFNNGLSAPQPDFVEGPGVNEFGPLPIEDYPDGAVLYKDNPDSITLPHLAGELKAPGKNLIHARLQSAYDGAALVHGRNQALDSLGEPSIAGHAKVTTFTTDGNYLNLFAHYATPSEDGTTKFHQYPVTSTTLTTSLQDFRQGYRQIRNAQDYGREESYKLRDQLKENWKAKESQPVPLPSIEDEDEDDCQVMDREPVYRPAPPTPSKPRHNRASRPSKGAGSE